MNILLVCEKPLLRTVEPPQQKLLSKSVIVDTEEEHCHVACHPILLKFYLATFLIGRLFSSQSN